MDKGARYYKADLHVHSSRDRNWKRKCVSADERDQFGHEMVAACRARGAQAIAITDHHDFGFVPHIREAARSEPDASGGPMPEQSLSRSRRSERGDRCSRHAETHHVGYGGRRESLPVAEGEVWLLAR